LYDLIVSNHRKLPDDRRAITKKFTIPHITDDSGESDALFSALAAEFPDADRERLAQTIRRVMVKPPTKMKFYVTAGSYADGTLGEIFIRADRAGSFISGALDMTAMVMSIALQHGVPLAAITAKMRHSRFPPYGFTGDPEFHSASSPFDLLAQWLSARFEAAPDDESAAPTPPAIARPLESL
jgi:hypothetical protein